MPEISLTIAFFSGVLTFFSACLIPIVPAYVSYISGVSLGELRDAEKNDKKKFSKYQRRIIANSLFFILGFSLIFILLGISATSFGRFLNENKFYFSRIGGLFMILLGIYLAGVIKIPFLYKGFRIKTKRKNKSFFVHSFFFGLAFGFSWTPCISPILAGILFLASLSQTIWQGGLLLSVFSLGIAIPFFAIALTITASLKYILKISKFSNIMKYFASAIIIIIGVLMVAGIWDGLIAKLVA